MPNCDVGLIWAFVEVLLSVGSYSGAFVTDFCDCGESNTVGLNGLGVVECVVSSSDVCPFEFTADEEVDVWVEEVREF